MSTSDHGAAAKFTAKCTLFRSWINSTLVGFASIEIVEIGLAAASIKAVLEHAPDAFDRGHQALPKATEA